MHSLRQATSDDVPRLSEIWRRAVLATHDFLSPDDFLEIQRFVRDEYLPTCAFVVAVDGADCVSGFMGMRGAHIDSLFVDPDKHGQGIGRALITSVRAEHPALTVDVNEQNHSAVGFYCHLGFEVTGRSRADDAGRPYPLLHFRLEGGRWRTLSRA